MAKVLVPLPALDFDPTEAAVTWKVLRDAGHEVVFATPEGRPSRADDLMVTGEGLDPWGFIPGLKKLIVVGAALRANAAGRRAYAELERDPRFLAPLRHDAVAADDYDGLVFPGGHRARGMRPFLESEHLQALVVRAFDLDRPLGAVCHGVLLVARSRSPQTGRSVLFGRKTTSLTWAQESLASRIGCVARFWDPGYYRTYPDGPTEARGFMGVQAEVTRALRSPADYCDVPADAPDRKRKVDGLHRDTVDDERPAFVVSDGNYVSARWPGDVHTFARTFARLLAAPPAGASRATTAS
jgi:putative intracellular protease/amidase